MQTQTLSVFWKGKFEGKAVVIDTTAFDPKLHRLESDGPWPAVKVEVKAPRVGRQIGS